MKKKTAIILLIILCAALLTPFPAMLKDGGTRVWTAVLYQVEDVHRLHPERTGDYLTGTVIRILGMEVFNNVK